MVRLKDNRHSKAFRVSRLQSGEQMLAVLVGYTGKMFGSGADKQINGSLIVTDRRIVFISKGLLSEIFESVEHANIVSTAISSSFGFRHIELRTPGKPLRFTTAAPAAAVDEAMRLVSNAQPSEATIAVGTSAAWTQPAARTAVASSPLDAPGTRLTPTAAKWLLGFPIGLLLVSMMTDGAPAFGLAALSTLAVAAVLYFKGRGRESGVPARFAAAVKQHRSAFLYYGCAIGLGSMLGLSIHAERAAKEAKEEAHQHALASSAPARISGAKEKLESARALLSAGNYAAAFAPLQAARSDLDSLADLKNKPADYPAIDASVGRHLAFAQASSESEQATHLLESGSADLAASLLLKAQQRLVGIAAELEEVGGPAAQARIENLLASAQQSRATEMIDQATKRLAAADDQYVAKNFEGARAGYYDLRAELTKTQSEADSPPSYRAWAEQALPGVSAKLDKAVRGKEFPDIAAYFKAWNTHRSDLRAEIEDLGSEQAFQAVAIKLAQPMVYLQYLEAMTPEESKFLPARYRSKSFIQARKKELTGLSNQADVEIAYVRSCGSKPEHSGWDGGNAEAERLVKQSAHDPDSIDVEKCSPPELTMRKCWQFTCDVRGKNMFGALILNRMTFRQDSTTIRSL